MSPIHVTFDPTIEGLGERLRSHPHVQAEPGSARLPIEFDQGDWHRALTSGAEGGFRGLVELMDNNPLVCADTFSVPDPGATLALVGLGPLIRAGLLVESPSVIASFELDEELVDGYLAEAGWPGGARYHSEHQPEGQVLALNAMALIETPEDLDTIDALYEEVYGHSFFVRRTEEGEWDIDLVEGKPYAAYRLRITQGNPHSLLTIQTMADRNGKVGAAQLVHAFNVMAGFEESVGVA